MARRGMKRRRSFKRKTGSSTFRMAKGALKAIKKLRSERENKFKDITEVLVVQQVAGGVTGRYLSGVAEGTTEGTRVGTQLDPTSLFFRYELDANTSAVGSVVVRLTLFKDHRTKRDAAGARTFPTQNDLYAVVNVMSPLHRTNAERFKVLYDKTHTVDWTHGPTTIVRKKYIRLSGKTTYKGATALIADSDTGHYFWLVTTSEATNRPTFEYNVRFSYTDS